MFQKQLDLPWHTSSLKDTSLQLISWNLRASRRKILWVTSFLWEGIIQAKSLLSDIFIPEFFQLSIHPDCFLSSEEKCLWKVMHFYPLLSDSFHLFIFCWKREKKSTFNVDVTALDTKVFALPAEQMESYNVNRANFPHCTVHLLSFIKASGKSLLNTRCINGCAGIESISPLPLLSGKECPLYYPHMRVLSLVISAVEESPIFRTGADLQLVPLSGRLSQPAPFLSPPPLVLICRKLGAGPEKMA